MRATRQLVLTVVLALTAINAWAQKNYADTKGSGESGSAANLAPGDANAPVTLGTVSPEPSYMIGVDDVLLISVWKEPDLTATLPVRPDGMISVPLLDDVQAAGLTPMQLASVLREKLKTYVTSPRVTVVVTQTNSHRVYVLGEVLHTGPISMVHKMTVLQALATAGFNEFANTKGIYILRNQNGKEQKIPFNYKQVMKGEGGSKNFLLQPGDMIVVP